MGGRRSSRPAEQDSHASRRDDSKTVALVKSEISVGVREGNEEPAVEFMASWDPSLFWPHVVGPDVQSPAS